MNGAYFGGLAGVGSPVVGAARATITRAAATTLRLITWVAFTHRFVRWRRLTAAAMHVPLIALASWMGFLLRFDGLIPAREWRVLVDTLPRR